MMVSECAFCEHNGGQNSIDSMCQVCFEGNMFEKEKTCWTCKHKYQCDPDDMFKCKGKDKRFYASE